MHRNTKLTLLALSATLVVGLGANTAPASRSITASPGGAIRMTSRALSFAPGEGPRVTAEATLTGSLHRTAISKTRGLAGFITSVDIASCNAEGFGGCSVVVLTLPWHIRLIGFTGTLPTITGATLEFVGSFEIRFIPPINLACLYEGALSTTTNGPRVTRLTTNRNSLPLIRGSECNESLEFRGTFTVSPTQELRLS